MKLFICILMLSFMVSCTNKRPGSKLWNNKYFMRCGQVGSDGDRVYRCENEEAICYYILGMGARGAGCMLKLKEK